jgi:tRNA threonylcarbamoyladenosine biosynthesis protein TsaB
MPTILALDTSADLASVALLREEEASFFESYGVQSHSRTVLPMVQKLLGQAGISLQDCSAIAFGCGPGSFTGVRTACGVAQGLAFGTDLPVVPIVTLEAMAEACRVATQCEDVLVALDARMREVYWAQYRYESGVWKVVSPPALSSAEDVEPRGAVAACGNGLSAYAEAFVHHAFLHSLPQVAPHALNVAHLGRAAFARGQALSAREAQPLYLRNKVAKTVAEREAEKTA